MSAISFPRHYAKRNAVVVHDVGGSMKTWGRRGVVTGGFVGFAVAAALVGIPLTTDVLTFGTVGTLIVGAVECAVIAGAFAAMAAAIAGRGVVRSDDTRLASILTGGRLPENANWREDVVPLTEWPKRWAYPTLPAINAILATPTTLEDRTLVA